MTAAILIVVVLLIVIPPIVIYNNLVTLRNRYKNGYSQIDVQLQRRHDLIPNLVETAKGYMAHERGTLEEVTHARNIAAAANQAAAASPGDPAAMHNISSAEGALGGALSRLLAVVESYPDLKANQNMMVLMEELTSTENKVAFARQEYNDSVMAYNTGCETFPNNVVAGAFNFAPAAPFQVDDAGVRAAPKVAF
ncbi:MAG: LemA family protein [Capsulimonadaceae bacterium]|nr:LemA family protein [Capsulimonadaceae bacterium]